MSARSRGRRRLRVGLEPARPDRPDPCAGCTISVAAPSAPRVVEHVDGELIGAVGDALHVELERKRRSRRSRPTPSNAPRSLTTSPGGGAAAPAAAGSRPLAAVRRAPSAAAPARSTGCRSVRAGRRTAWTNRRRHARCGSRSSWRSRAASVHGRPASSTCPLAISRRISAVLPSRVASAICLSIASICALSSPWAVPIVLRVL